MGGMIDLCVMCGEPSTREFMKQSVCDNVVCQVSLLDMVNGEAQAASYEAWDQAKPEVEVVNE